MVPGGPGQSLGTQHNTANTAGHVVADSPYTTLQVFLLHLVKTTVTTTTGTQGV